MSKEFKIGLITILSGALFYYGFNFLRGFNLFSPTERYFVTYPNVTGLNISNPIYFNGLPVGRVNGFELQQIKNRIVVSLDIDGNVAISEDAKATLANDGLFGGKAIILDVGKSEMILTPGDTLQSDIDGDLLSQFEPVADNLNTTITKLNDLLDQLNATDIKGTVDALKYSIGLLTTKANRINVQKPIDSLTVLISSFKERSNQLEGVIAGSESLIDSLNALPLRVTIAKFNQSIDQLNTIMRAVQSEEGTVGKILNDDSIYDNLNKLLIDMDALIIHFDSYPKDFMKPLGRKNKKLKGISPKAE